MTLHVIREKGGGEVEPRCGIDAFFERALIFSVSIGEAIVKSAKFSMQCQGTS